ncbi:MAG TPA: hypothetical protein PLU53_15385, partial [Bacteroidia bacterium]|nr:hypothetical protein [Bacteroidia bacterium]
KMFFSANNASTGQELYSYNGSTVTLEMDINPGTASGLPSYFCLAGPYMYFRADDGISGQEIWVETGTARGILSDVHTGPPGSDVSSPGMVAYNGNPYFAAFTSSLGTEVWSYIPPNVSPSPEIIFGPGSANPSLLTIYNNRLYVQADDVVNGSELWEYSLPAPNYNYRTAGNGNWNDSTTWEVFDGTYWIPAEDAPNGANGGTITIRAGHTVSNNSLNIDADELVIENGGTLNISEGTLNILNGSGVDMVCNGSLNINTGSIRSNGIVEFSSSSSFSLGSLSQLMGPGIFNILGGAVFSITDSPCTLEDTCVVNNYSTCNYGSNADLTIGLASVFNNYGTFSITNSGDVNSNSSDGVFNNMVGGHVSKEGNDISVFSPGFTFNNYGNLTIMEGILSIDGSNGVLGGYVQIDPSTEFAGNELVFTGDTIENNGVISIVAFSMGGTTSQFITGTGQISSLLFGNPSGITLAGDQTVTDNLIFDQGLVYTLENSLVIGETAAVSGASALSYVVGNMQRYFASPNTLTYDIGDVDAYLPITLTPDVSAPGYFLARTEAGDHPAIATSGIDQDKSVNRFWTITNISATFSSLGAHLTWSATDLDPSSNPLNFVAAKYDDPNWAPVSVTNNDTLSITIGSLQSMSDFQIGEALIEPAEALHFDGVDDVVTGPGEVIPINDSPYTVSVWAKYDTPVFGEMNAILSQGRNFYIGQNFDGVIRVGDAWYTTVPFPQDASWHNYTVVRTADNTYLYVDGVLAEASGYAIPSPTSTPPSNPVANFYIGAQWNGAENWRGSIDAVRVWNRALCAAEIDLTFSCEMAGYEYGMVASYNFNVGTAGGNNNSPALDTLADVSGNGFNCILQNFALTGSTSNWIKPVGFNIGGCAPISITSV